MLMNICVNMGLIMCVDRGMDMGVYIGANNKMGMDMGVNIGANIAVILLVNKFVNMM